MLEHTETFARKQLIKWVTVLVNDHHLPLVVALRNKKGELETWGTNRLKNKFHETYRRSQTWAVVWDEEQKTLNELKQKKYFKVPPSKALKDARTKPQIPLLCYPIEVMDHPELCGYVPKLILHDYFKKGGKYNRVQYGVSEFCPPWWLNERWDWSTVTCNFTNAKNAFPGHGQMTEFLRDSVKAFFDFYSLDIEDFVKQSYCHEEYQRRINKKTV